MRRSLATAWPGRLDRPRTIYSDSPICGPELLQRLRTCANGGFVPGRPRFEREVTAMVGRRAWNGSPGRLRKDTYEGKQGEFAL